MTWGLATNIAELAECALHALHAHIAVVDEHGEILAVNTAWRQFAQLNTPSGSLTKHLLEGTNYLAVCDRAGTGDSLRFATGIRSVLDGSRPSFTLEYACEGPKGPRWFIGVVTPLAGYPKPGAVIAHHEITERKLAEEALQREENRTKDLISQLQNTQSELEDKIHDLETFHDVVVDRELRLIELEKENRALRASVLTLNEGTGAHSQDK